MERQRHFAYRGGTDEDRGVFEECVCAGVRRSIGDKLIVCSISQSHGFVKSWIIIAITVVTRTPAPNST